MPRPADLTEPDRSRPVRVAAGILWDAQDRILIAERLDDAAFCGIWEFPGGKVAAGETAAEALCRELAEELGIEVREHRQFMHLKHDYPDRRVSIDFFLVHSWRGEPQGLLGQRLRWVVRGDLDRNVLMPADLPVVEALGRLARGSPRFSKC